MFSTHMVTLNTVNQSLTISVYGLTSNQLCGAKTMSCCGVS
jgi:hypothetical protein